ncbi:MAG: hypothetical protein EZS28_031681 [Streblomastix strix]|uniref:Uncharacterized protein n=1 Tax=Streblomastix strix TaxID=222440 RepID=A0A5J4URX0_9EUKA|nr:MAG: hypothetical protein EZS28_031681 [Streblomastix strix]
MPIVQLDQDVFRSDRQLAPNTVICTQIQRTAPLLLIQGQILQLQEGIAGAQHQKNDFNTTYILYTQVQEVIQLATWSPLLLMHRDTSCRSTIPDIILDEQLAPFKQSNRSIDKHCLRISPGLQAGIKRNYAKNKADFMD